MNLSTLLQYTIEEGILLLTKVSGAFLFQIICAGDYKQLKEALYFYESFGHCSIQTICAGGKETNQQKNEHEWDSTFQRFHKN
jgi:hypothetical protein